MTTPAGVTTSYGYDNVGEKTTVTDGAGNTTTTSYDFAGRVTKALLPDGTAGTATYDGAGRPIRIAKLDGQGTVLSSRSATLDSNGNPLTTTDARGNTVRYTYDAMNRLSTEVQPVTPTSSITTSFGYDAAGNRTRFTDGRSNPFITTYNSWNLPESTIEQVRADFTVAKEHV